MNLKTNFFFLLNSISLIFKPWSYNEKIRIYLSKLFFFENRYYSQHDMLNNIISSEKIKKTYLQNAIIFNDRYYLLKYCCMLNKSNKNAVAEFGVYNGKTLKIIANQLTDRDCYGFDSFEGLPRPWGNLLPKGYFKTQVPYFKEKNIKIIKGVFEKTLNSFIEKNQEMTFDLVHIDCDLYDSTIFILNKIQANLNKNGFILIFDEFYGYKDFEKYEFKAFNEFLGNTTKYKVKPIGYSSHSAAFLIKI